MPEIKHIFRDSNSYKKGTGQDFSVDSRGLNVILLSVHIIIMIVMM